MSLDTIKIPTPDEKKATDEELKMYTNWPDEFYDTPIDNRYEIIDNEKLNKNFDNLSQKTNETLNEKERALKLLNIIDKKWEWDIDLAFDKETWLYHLIMWSHEIIKNWDLSEDTLEIIKATWFEWLTLDQMENMINDNRI